MSTLHDSTAGLTAKDVHAAEVRQSRWPGRGALEPRALHGGGVLAALETVPHKHPWVVEPGHLKDAARLVCNPTQDAESMGCQGVGTLVEYQELVLIIF